MKQKKTPDYYFSKAKEIYKDPSNIRKDGELKSKAQKKIDKMSIKIVHLYDIMEGKNVNEFIY